jgi:hypothetical protein
VLGVVAGVLEQPFDFGLLIVYLLIGLLVIYLRSKLYSLGKRRDPKKHQREYQLLRDMEDGQLEGARFIGYRTFRYHPKTRYITSLRLCDEQGTRQQTQFFIY